MVVLLTSIFADINLYSTLYEFWRFLPQPKAANITKVTITAYQTLLNYFLYKTKVIFLLQKSFSIVHYLNLGKAV